MRGKSIGAVVLAAAALALVPAALADEVVHFRNGAEMAVRAHKVAGEMVTLDLGGGNSIAFPLAMVDKIANAGQDVYLNPVYHPANQAVAGSQSEAPAPIPVQDLHITGGSAEAPGAVRLPGGMASRTGFRGTGIAAAQQDQYQRQNGLTTTPLGPAGSVRKVVRPSVDVPVSSGEPTTVDSPATSRVRTYPQMVPIPPRPAAPPAPPASSDGKTEAGTPPPQSN